MRHQRTKFSRSPLTFSFKKSLDDISSALANNTFMDEEPIIDRKAMAASTLEKNLSIIQHRWPNIGQQLFDAASTEICVSIDKTP